MRTAGTLHTLALASKSWGQHSKRT
jgi:hypothetical protein